MIRSIAGYLCRKKLERINASRKKQFLNWKAVDRIALLLDQADKPSKHEIDQYCVSLKKYIEVFLVDTSGGKPLYGDWICFTRKDRNWLGLPRKKTLAVFNERKYDALIFAGRERVFTAALCMQINATCKCGNVNVFGEMDLIVERKETQDLISYLKEVQRYFEMIRNS